MKKIFLFIFCLVSTLAFADGDRKDSLFVDVDVKAFIIDHEYQGDFRSGYTLPGARIIPRARYKPISKLEFELGLSAMLFNGANKYPCYAFKDISTWKGDQYQRGVHLLPWYRVKFATGTPDKGRNEITLGCLENNRDYITPFFNPELYYSKDPDMGIEYRLAYKRYKLDAWIDWQSFIFKEDKHQESFWFGLQQSLKVFEKNNFSIVVPLHVMAQHYGGEIDDTNTGKTTIFNAATGIQGYWKKPSRHANSASAELLLLYYNIDEVTDDIPIKNGLAFWGSIAYNIRQKVDMKLGVFHSRQFLSLYGSPFFSTVSMTTPGATFTHATTTMLDVRYTPLDCKYGKLSVFATGYLTGAGYMIDSDGTRLKDKELVPSFSLGATFTAPLSFLVWHRKNKTSK